MTRYLLLIVCLVVPVSAMAASNDCLVSATAPTLQAGQSAPCSLDTSGNLRTSGTFSGSITGADGSITDGVNAAVKATVQDYTNSNPLAVILTDTNGDPATLGAGGGGTEYAQGTASTTTDAMTMAGCVRVDTPAVASGVIDGDRARCIVDSTNRMWVHVGVIDGTVGVTQSGTWNLNALTSITNPVAVTGTFWQATQPVSGTVTANAGTGNFTVVQPTGTNLHIVCDSGCSSSAGFSDNNAFTFGTTAINPIGGVLDDTATNAATENSAAVARITAQKALHMNLRNNSGTEIGTAGAPIRTDPTGSTTQPVSGTVSITANSAVNVAQMNGVATSMGVGASGTGTQRVASLIHDGTDTAQVTATGGGSLQVECSAGCSGGTQYAEDSVHVSGDTLTLAGVVRQDSTAALAADGDRTVLQVDSNGHLKVVNDNPNLAADNSTNSTAKVPIIAARANASAPTWTEGNQVPLSVDTSGALRVTGGTSATQYTEDAASAGAESMTLAGTIRQDTPAGSTSADGDYASLKTDSVGRLWVNGSGVTQPVSGTITANAGTNLNTSALLTTSAHDAAFGTAGTADTQVRTVQGIASMTPLLVNPGTATNFGIYAEDAAETAGGNLSMAGSVRRDTAASSAGTTGDNATLNTDANGLLWSRNADPCSALAKTFIPINISTATTTELTAALAGASTNYYVCSLNLVTAAANNVALADDDTDNCASVTSGLAGGTTAGSGWNLAANGGLTFGNGTGSIFKTNGANRVLCLVTSAATQLSGSITVVAAP